MFTDNDHTFMRTALELAAKGRYSTRPNPAVGCVVVKQGRIIGQGWHRKAGEPHAERLALAQAGEAARGATVYVTLEPCAHHGRTPPCANALVEAAVGKVVVAMLDPNPLVAGKGIDILQQAGIDTQVGLFESQARALNPGFIKVMEQQLPYVRLKMASSLDGRTAMANGESQWITGPQSREEVHKLRALSDAVVTGIGTVLADDPSLNVRLPQALRDEMGLDAEHKGPLRVVLDPNLSMPLDAKMLSLAGRTLLLTTREAADREAHHAQMLLGRGAEIVVVAGDESHLEIASILDYLAREESVREVLVESGAMVAGAFMQSGCVDELHCFIAPVLMGHLAKPMFVLPGLESMQDRLSLKIQSVTPFGEDVRLILTPHSHGGSFE
jgi:diaminohydroxyphosphoribosylaminopyrimidine deaminase/5-amino-6-(5-phosphoribosylamino)uracil reductase